MRRAWLIIVAAALGAVATTTRPAAAGPFDFFSDDEPSSAESDSGSWTDALTPWRSEPKPKATAAMTRASAPSKTISPWRHPIQYFSAAMSETPVAESLKGDKSESKVVMQHDQISLDTPTGPPTPQFHISMAQMAERQGNVAQARRQMQQAVTTWPRDVEILRAAARLEDRQGQLAVAESLYHRAVAANPQHAGAHNDLGLCLARQGKLGQSIQEIEQAVCLQPDKALYRNNAATVLVELRQDQRALAHLSAVHGSAAANYNLGRLLADRGRPHEAIVYFQSALDMDPTMEPARTAITQLNGTPAQVVAERPQPAANPAYSPQTPPQPPATEPAFPATARYPEYGTSSYVPPAGYYPSTPIAPMAPAAPIYQTATAPRYLPPVQTSVPGTMVR